MKKINLICIYILIAVIIVINIILLVRIQPQTVVQVETQTVEVEKEVKVVDQELLDAAKEEAVQEYIAEQNSIIGTIKICVITPDEDVIMVSTQGALHTQLTMEQIEAAVNADSRIDFTKWTIKRIERTKAVEFFADFEYESVRVVYLMNK